MTTLNNKEMELVNGGILYYVIGSETELPEPSFSNAFGDPFYFKTDKDHKKNGQPSELRNTAPVIPDPAQNQKVGGEATKDYTVLAR